MTQAKLFAKLGAIQTQAAELTALLAAMPDGIPADYLSDVAAELTEVMACLKTVKRDAVELTAVFA